MPEPPVPKPYQRIEFAADALPGQVDAVAVQARCGDLCERYRWRRVERPVLDEQLATSPAVSLQPATDGQTATLGDLIDVFHQLAEEFDLVWTIEGMFTLDANGPDEELFSFLTVFNDAAEAAGTQSLGLPGSLGLPDSLGLADTKDVDADDDGGPATLKFPGA